MSDQKIVIVLHGPPGSGKSAICHEIVSQFRARRISLDDYWGVGERRFNGGDARYEDIANATEQILVIELGLGEPAGFGFHGATRNAQEWVNVLRRSGRVIFPFLLTTDPTEIINRLRNRNPLHLAPDPHFWETCRYLGVNFLYEHHDAIVTFPTISDFNEQILPTSGRTVTQVTEDIFSRVGAAGITI